MSHNEHMQALAEMFSTGSSTSRWFAAVGALLAAAVPLLERALTGLLGLLSGAHTDMGNHDFIEWGGAYFKTRGTSNPTTGGKLVIDTKEQRLLRRENLGSA